MVILAIQLSQIQVIKMEDPAAPLPAFVVSLNPFRRTYERILSFFIGFTAAYCGAGCQNAYGSCFGVSPAATQSGNLWVVNGAGSFTTSKTITFTGTTLTSELVRSAYRVNDTEQPPYAAKYDHQFMPALATVSGGYLQLKVPGGQNTNPLQCSEVETSAQNILYASVRTTAILGGPAGTCNGKLARKSLLVMTQTAHSTPQACSSLKRTVKRWTLNISVIPPPPLILAMAPSRCSIRISLAVIQTPTTPLPLLLMLPRSLTSIVSTGYQVRRCTILTASCKRQSR